MERFVRVLAVIFWVAATLFVALLFTAGLSYDFVVGLLGSERLETITNLAINPATHRRIWDGGKSGL